MTLDGAKVVGKGIARGFARLGHEIGNVNPRCLGLSDSGRDFRNQEIRKNTGVERTGAEENQVSVTNGFDDRGKRADSTRREGQLLDGRAARGDARFPVNGAAVFERGYEVDIRNCRGKDTAADGEDFAANADGFDEISGDVSERREKQIPEIMTAQAAPGVKAVLKQPPQQGLIFRKSHHAIANIAGRQNAIFTAQSAGAAAIIGDRDDGGQVDDRTLGVGAFVTAAHNMFFEATEQRGKTRAPAESDDAETARERFWLRGAFFHQMNLEDGSVCFLRNRVKHNVSEERKNAEPKSNREKRITLDQPAVPSFSAYSSSVNRGSSCKKAKSSSFRA